MKERERERKNERKRERERERKKEREKERKRERKKECMFVCRQDVYFCDEYYIYFYIYKMCICTFFTVL